MPKNASTIEFKECSRCTAENPEPHTEHDGQEIETIHGEQLIVMKTEILLLKKRGKVTGETQQRVQAMSGGMPTWFPIHLIKTEQAEDGEE